jgi:hypothetical protein
MPQGKKSVSWSAGLIRPASPSGQEPSPSSAVGSIVPVSKIKKAEPYSWELRAKHVLAAFNIDAPNRVSVESGEFDEATDKLIELYKLRLAYLVNSKPLIEQLERIERIETFVDTATPGRHKVKSLLVQALRENTHQILKNLMASPDDQRLAALAGVEENIAGYAQAEGIMRLNPWLQELQDLSAVAGSLEASLIKYLQEQAQEVFKYQFDGRISGKEAAEYIAAIQEKYSKLQALFTSRTMLETLEKFDEFFALGRHGSKAMHEESIQVLVGFIEGDLEGGMPKLSELMTEGLERLDKQVKADLRLLVEDIATCSESRGRGILLAALRPVAQALAQQVARDPGMINRAQWVKIRTFQKALHPDKHSSMRLLLEALARIQNLKAEGDLGHGVIKKLQQKAIEICQNLRFINDTETALTIPEASAQILAHLGSDARIAEVDTQIPAESKLDAMNTFLSLLNDIDGLSGDFAKGSPQDAVIQRVQKEVMGVCQNLSFFKDAGPVLTLKQANRQIEEHCEKGAGLVMVLAEILALSAPRGSAELIAVDVLKQKARLECAALVATEGHPTLTMNESLQNLNIALESFRKIKRLEQVGSMHHAGEGSWFNSNAKYRRKIDEIVKNAFTSFGSANKRIEQITEDAIRDVRRVGADAREERERRSSYSIAVIFGRSRSASVSPSPLAEEINEVVRRVSPVH